MANSRTDSARAKYRHGDLHRALVAAGMDLARAGGPDAVVLREATRRVGVSPTAAYRHFADHHALLRAVCAAAFSALAIAIERELAALPAESPPATTARARVRAVGTGYLRFARSEPGLFRTAFSISDAVRASGDVTGTGGSGLTPLQLLAAALDDMVAAGILLPDRRPGAEILAWSAVHGLAMLVIGGPLREMDRPQFETLGQRLLDMVERGL